MGVAASCWGGDGLCEKDAGDLPDVYDWALEGGVKAGVALAGEWAVVAAIVAALVAFAEVVAVAWLEGS